MAGVIDDIGPAEAINDLAGTHPLERVSGGRLAKAVIQGGLGFVSAPLCLLGEFFTGRATEHLLGDGVTPEVLNDVELARALDAPHQDDLTGVFVSVAAKACRACAHERPQDTVQDGVSP